MFRIIDGIGFEGKLGKRFKVKAFVVNGHTEVTAHKVIEWSEVGPISDLAMRHYLEAKAQHLEENKAEREVQIREKACKRAKRAVRRLCKTMGADTLLTLTYRACEADLAQVKRDLKEFNRRMKKLIPDFCFVAAFEKQKRGAWHMHLATRAIPDSLPAVNGVKVKSFNIIRAVWRGVVGERGGNIDVSRRKRHSTRSAASIASYIAKYVAKDFGEGDKWVNRYAVYGGVEVPEAVVLGFADSCLEAIDIAVSLIGSDDRIINLVLSRFKDSFYLSAERPS